VKADRSIVDAVEYENRYLREYIEARRKMPGEARYTLRVALADGQEITSATSVQYVDGCPPPAVHASLAAGPTGRIETASRGPHAGSAERGQR
jgi:hypothetical protein